MRKTEKIDYFIDQILVWNKKINLTGLKTREEIDRVLIKQSLDAVHLIPDSDGIRIMDIGTGCGIPGIPIKIWKPGIRMDFVERNKKKTVFIKKIIRDLHLENCKVYNCDYRELLSEPSCKVSCDYMLMRGVGFDETSLAEAKVLLKTTGKILLWHVEKGKTTIRILDG